MQLQATRIYAKKQKRIKLITEWYPRDNKRSQGPKDVNMVAW